MSTLILRIIETLLFSNIVDFADVIEINFFPIGKVCRLLK